MVVPTFRQSLQGSGELMTNSRKAAFNGVIGVIWAGNEGDVRVLLNPYGRLIKGVFVLRAPS